MKVKKNNNIRIITQKCGKGAMFKIQKKDDYGLNMWLPKRAIYMEFSSIGKCYIGSSK